MARQLRGILSVEDGQDGIGNPEGKGEGSIHPWSARSRGPANPFVMESFWSEKTLY